MGFSQETSAGLEAALLMRRALWMTADAIVEMLRLDRSRVAGWPTAAGLLRLARLVSARLRAC